MPVKKSKPMPVAMSGARDTAEGDMKPETKIRTVAVPNDLKAALSRHPAPNSLFSSLPYSHKKEYNDWITGAKRPGTRKARIQKMLKMLAEKKPRG